MGVERPQPLYPSLLLGAVELTPYQMAQLYNTIANGGFRAPLRAVRAIVDTQGRTLQRYSLAIEQVADPVAVYALNQGLVQVMERGTGARGLRAIIEEVLLNVMYDVPSREDIGKVVVTGEVVSDNVNPTLIPRKDEPKKKKSA